MGFFFEFDRQNNVVRCCWEGPITDGVLLEGYSAAEKLMASRPSCRGINGFSRVTKFDVSSETITRLAEMPPVLGIKTVTVIVAPRDFEYGLARMFSTLGEQSRPNLYVVHTLEEAKAVLGVDSPQFSRISID